MVYAAQFSKHMPLVAAGGSGANEARVFDCERGNAPSAGRRRGFGSRLDFTVDFAPGGKRLAGRGRRRRRDPRARRRSTRPRGRRSGPGRPRRSPRRRRRRRSRSCAARRAAGRAGAMDPL